jgi:four helix bundle protein
MRERQDLRERTKQFALQIVKIYSSLPKTTEAQIIGKQVLRSGTSVGAHYREAARARSNAEFISKIEGALQELDETGYWFELLVESGIVTKERLSGLVSETEELLAILTICSKNVKKRMG